MRQGWQVAVMVGLIVILAGATAQVSDSPREGPRALKATEHRIGELIEDVSFVDTRGTAGRLSDFRGRPLVVCMTALNCPLAKKYAPVLTDLEKQYQDQAVTFLFVNPNPHDAPEAVKA